MSTVEIEYCVPCGFRERAVGLAAAILADSETELDELAFVTGDHGVLQVSVDGETVYDKELEPFDESVIVSAVGDAL